MASTCRWICWRSFVIRSSTFCPCRGRRAAGVALKRLDGAGLVRPAFAGPRPSPSSYGLPRPLWLLLVQAGHRAWSFRSDSLRPRHRPRELRSSGDEPEYEKEGKSLRESHPSFARPLRGRHPQRRREAPRPRYSPSRTPTRSKLGAAGAELSITGSGVRKATSKPGRRASLEDSLPHLDDPSPPVDRRGGPLPTDDRRSARIVQQARPKSDGRKPSRPRRRRTIPRANPDDFQRALVGPVADQVRPRRHRTGASQREARGNVCRLSGSSSGLPEQAHINRMG